MLVKCIENSIQKLSKNDWFDSDMFNMADGTINLVKGEYYVVYAIDFVKPYTLYYISDSTFTTYPVSYQAQLFDVYDERISRYWETNSNKLLQDLKNNASGLISFKSWSESRTFYEKLVEGNAAEERKFLEMKRKMDLEFKAPNITVALKVVDNDWVECPMCQFVFKFKEHRDESTSCPNCNNIALSP